MQKKLVEGNELEEFVSKQVLPCLNDSFTQFSVTMEGMDILSQVTESFANDLVKKAILLKSNQKNTTRNKSIRKEDIFTVLCESSEYSFLGEAWNTGCYFVSVINNEF